MNVCFSFPCPDVNAHEVVTVKQNNDDFSGIPWRLLPAAVGGLKFPLCTLSLVGRTKSGLIAEWPIASE